MAYILMAYIVMAYVVMAESTVSSACAVPLSRMLRHWSISASDTFSGGRKRSTSPVPAVRTRRLRSRQALLMAAAVPAGCSWFELAITKTR